ncbi:MAG: cupin domain-containing protein [Actinomycetota bacterium]|nr:cupin domain-containing protein [Actinomycetota bacterium]
MSHYLADLAGRIEVSPGSTVSTTVLKEPGARLVLFSFDAGEELSEHTAAMPVLLQAVSGRMSVTTADATASLVPGDALYLEAREPHSVLAEEPSKLLLTMLDPRGGAAT